MLEKPDLFSDSFVEDLFSFAKLTQQPVMAVLNSVPVSAPEQEFEAKKAPLLADRDDEWLATRRYAIKGEIAICERASEALRAERDSIDQEFLERFDERKSEGTKTSTYTISKSRDFNYPQIDDQTAFERYVLRTHKLYLYQKRVAVKTIQEELAIFALEKKEFLDFLEAAEYDAESCAAVFCKLYENMDDKPPQEVFGTKLLALTLANRLKEGVLEELETFYSIPGIVVVTKTRINQVHR
jgi:hypothetical protein